MRGEREGEGELGGGRDRRQERGPSGMTGGADLVTALLARAATEPHRVAIRDHRARSVTYGELGSDVRAVAAHLTAHGVVPGDGVLLAVRPSPRAVAAALGVVLARGCRRRGRPRRGAGAARRAASRRAPCTRRSRTPSCTPPVTGRCSLTARAAAGHLGPAAARPVGGRARPRRHRSTAPRGAAHRDPVGTPAGGAVGAASSGIPRATHSSSSRRARPPRPGRSCTPSRRSRRGSAPPSRHSASTPTTPCTPTS